MTTGAATAAWVVRPQASRGARLRLFCFPYAGGGAAIFHGWWQKLQPGIDVCAVQLPGRGNRLHETPHRRLAPLVDELADALAPYLDLPAAFFGHSMGAVIAFELARVLRERTGAEPRHLFVSGRRAPHLKRDLPVAQDVSDAEFVAEVQRLKGTPAQVLANPELLQLVLPMLRADFALCDSYEYVPGPPLGCAVTAFGGLADEDTPREEVAAWSDHTSGRFVLRMLPGDHFFVTSSPETLMRAIVTDLEGRPVPAAPRTPRPDLDGALAAWARKTRTSVIQEMLSLKPRPGHISLALGLPAVELFPVRELAQAAQSVLAEEPGALQYSPPSESVKRHVAALMARRGAPCRPEQVFLTAGAQQGMSLLARLFLESRAPVVAEELIYPGFQQVIEPFEPDVRTVPTDIEGGMDVEAVAAHLARAPRPGLVYVIPDGHNPMAVSLDPSRRRELVESARRVGVPVIEDDPYGLLHYDGAPVPPLRALDEEWVFYVGSFSKVLAPALRAGWLVVPEAALPRLGVAKEAADINSAPFTQRVIARVLDVLSLDAHLDALRRTYGQRLDAMMAALERHFPEEARWRRPAAGLFVWVEVPEGIDTLSLLRRAVEEERVGFLPGEAFEVHRGRARRPGLRLNFSSVPCEEVEEGVARLGRLLKRAMGARVLTRAKEQRT